MVLVRGSTLDFSLSGCQILTSKVSPRTESINAKKYLIIKCYCSIFSVGIILLSFLNWVGAADTTYPKEVLGIQTGDLIEAATDVTKSGSVIIKYQQVHCGFPVLGSQAVLEKMDKGDGVWGEIHDNQITAQMQELLPESCIGASPSLSKQALYEQTVQQENDNIANLIPFNETLDAVTYWIYQEQSHEIRLTCQLTYVIVSNSSNNTNAPLRKTFHVDAKTSEITLRDVSVVSFSYDMTGIGGNIIIGKHEFGNWDWAGRKLRVNRLNSDKCEAVNDYVKVHSGDGTITCGNKVAKQDCDSHNMYSSHSFNQVNDALFYTTDFLEMLKNQYYDTSLPKFCGQMYTCVNYGAYDNAYYTSCQTYYGLGNVHFYGLATADVVAHELCHGVTAATSGLYYWAESGGMNEAFSDICGETYEAFLNHGNNDWKIGYGIMKNPSGNDALRYMFWPPKDDRSIQCQSDYKKGLDVHYSSGLYNKAFYLLANTKGWCIKRAFQVFLRANKFIWQPASKFNSGACGVIWAAGLFGYSTSDVEDAFAAVGIFCGKCSSLHSYCCL